MDCHNVFHILLDVMQALDEIMVNLMFGFNLEISQCWKAAFRLFLVFSHWLLLLVSARGSVNCIELP